MKKTVTITDNRTGNAKPKKEAEVLDRTRNFKMRKLRGKQQN